MRSAPLICCRHDTTMGLPRSSEIWIDLDSTRGEWPHRIHVGLGVTAWAAMACDESCEVVAIEAAAGQQRENHQIESPQAPNPTDSRLMRNVQRLVC